MGNGKLIVFEGIDGTGKDGAVERAYSWLRDGLGPGTVVRTKDPGGTTLGNVVRDLLFKDPTTRGMAVGVPDLLFLASHLQNWEMVVKPALDSGKIVVSDRWWYSQMAYMAHRKVPDKVAEAYWSCKGPSADLLIVLTCDVAEAMARTRGRGEQHQAGKSWDDAGTLSHVQESYFQMFSARPEFRAVSTTQKSRDGVWDEVLGVLSDFLGAS